MFVGSWKTGCSLPVLMQGHVDGNIWYDHMSCQYNQNGIQICFWGTLYNKVKLGYEGILNNAEVIALIYEKKGYFGLGLLDGSFTIFIRTRDLLFIVRDHHGTDSQIYYTDFYFASSLLLLQQTEGFCNQPNFEALSSFLTVGYIQTPYSSFLGVSKLGAGEALIYQNGQLIVKNLYPADFTLPLDGTKTLEEVSEQYGILHAEAIKKRIGNSKNVGILLSGGYDSGCNLAALRQLYQGDIHSFTIGFKGDKWTELPSARRMSDTFQTIHSEYEIEGNELVALPEIVEHLGDPFVEGGLMVNYTAMRMIGNNKPDIVLGGDGNDQYFGTAGREVALHYLISKYGLKSVISILLRLLNQSHFDSNNKFFRLRFYLKKILNILQEDPFGFTPFQLKDMLQDSSFYSIPKKVRTDTRSFEHLFMQHFYKVDLEKINNHVILFKASKMAAMFGNTIAFPYMDLDLYHFLTQLPVQYKCKGDNVKAIARGQSISKFLLKYHYKPMLPEMVTATQGGFAPMPLFFKDDRQRTRLADYIMSSSITDNYLKRSSVESFIKKYDCEVHDSGSWFWYKQSKAIQYFNLLTLAVWWERFVEGNKDTNVLK